MQKEVIYFRYHDESEIEDIINNLQRHAKPNRNIYIYYDSYTGTESLDWLIFDINNLKYNFRIIAPEKSHILPNDNLVNLINNGKAKIFLAKEGVLIDKVN